MGASSRLVKSNELGLKKRLGQHFLRDTGVLERIVRWIKPASDDIFLDIGAGDGALSVGLAPRVARLLAIEVDADCIPELQRALARFGNATVIVGDILQLDLAELVSPHSQHNRKLRVAGNLPYHIATAIIDKLLHSLLPIEDLFFMVQLEVAQRIIACPGSRQYGFLSVHCQHHSDIQMGFKVSPACFVPRPRVSSAILSFRPKPASRDPFWEVDFDALAKAAFSYRRKTLENSLCKHPVFGKISQALLSQADIDGSRRAEALSLSEYERLVHVFHSCFSPRL